MAARLLGGSPDLACGGPYFICRAAPTLLLPSAFDENSHFINCLDVIVYSHYLDDLAATNVSAF
jgi:hypothetical protein